MRSVRHTDNVLIRSQEAPGQGPKLHLGPTKAKSPSAAATSQPSPLGTTAGGNRVMKDAHSLSQDLTAKPQVSIYLLTD